MINSNYRNEINGLRAIAIISVIFFHAGFDFFSGGFLGVDIFFVISGYLITNIIYVNYFNQTFNIFEFYEKRLRRIIPALFIIILLFIPICFFALYPRDLRDFGQSLFSLGYFLSNIYFWYRSGYFDTNSELRPLLHTWSLSLEVQFYILFPLLLIFIIRSKKLIFLLSMLVIISFAFAKINSFSNPSINFYFLISRLWQFLLGSIVFIMLEKKVYAIKFLKNFNILGLILILLSILFIKKNTITPSLNSVLVTVGTCMILFCSNPKNLINLFLSNKFFTFIGSISYSLYLWHFPFFSIANYKGINEANEIKWLIILITIALSFLTYVFIEKPFRSKKISTKKTFFLIAIIFLIFNIIGLKLHYSNLSQIASFRGYNHWLFKYDINNLKKNAVNLTNNLSVPTDYKKIYINKDNKDKVLIIGDSIANDAVSAIKLNLTGNSPFILWNLSFDDLCLNFKHQSQSCKINRKNIINNYSLITEADLIIYLVGFHSDTKVENIIQVIGDLNVKKLRVLSSAHFNEPYSIIKKIESKQLSVDDEEKLDLIYGSEIHEYTYLSSIRAKKILNKINIPFVLGWDIWCSKVESLYSCPFIRNKKILIFDTAHKTIDGLNLYGKKLLVFINQNLNELNSSE